MTPDPVGSAVARFLLRARPPNPKRLHLQLRYEVEAVDPDVLRRLVVNAVEERADMDVLNAVKEEETDEQAKILEYIERFDDDGDDS